MRNNVLISALSLVAMLTLGWSLGHAAVRVGVNAHRGPDYVMATWSELGQYLSEKLKQEVTIVPLKVASLMFDVKRENIDFVFANPVQTVRLKKSYQTIPLATLNTKEGSQFAGVIVARSDSGIRKSEDLRGKNVGSMRFKVAAGAYIFQTYHLLQKGINPHKDFASIKQVRDQNDLIRAVKIGYFDAAFIRSGLLEKLAKAGQIEMDDFVVVDHQAPTAELPFVHTTALYPEWYISVMPHVDKTLRNKMGSALLQLPANHKASQAANIRGFVAPIKLDGLETAMQALKVPPYDRSQDSVARTSTDPVQAK